MNVLNVGFSTADILGINAFHLEQVSQHGPRELSLSELELVGGGVNWSQVGQAATIGAVAGAIGGGVTGAMAGAFLGGLGAGPGALAGAGLGGIGGAVTGAVTSIMVQYMAN
ncbi:hypothetical protein PDM28_01865 [Stenotrophomonas aracearum]|jgi:hypothetical protein|uniref:Bacteriocin n=1 Tax=Stenotrophomonas aracearum TaxID=3003272 RepID=A0ABY9YE11_9GAMM|nr:hypothetical protein [Stenotrophomonas sp. A5588]WNH49106.1 hypothetical protein PDM28_01865 [Stenotrophomonas sp. A5588]